MHKIDELLFEKQDIKYGDFIAKLTPTVRRENIIGVRVPQIRSFVKQLSEEEKETFLNELPHKYYEENLLHGFIIQSIKKYNIAINKTEEFLPFVNNWACSDTMMPKCFIKNKNDLYIRIIKWIKSRETYKVRFGLLCLMNCFLEDDFSDEIIELPLSIKSDEYYINIMIAWFYATALAKQYDSTIKLIESKKLEKWIQNKTIQKSIESRRVTDEHKAHLKTLKK